MSRLTRWMRGGDKAPPHLPIVASELPAEPQEPSAHLLQVPRFTPRMELLLGFPFEVADGPSFYANYQEIFEREIYRFTASTPAPRIIDCGANCGQSTIYFKHLYPSARITAIEADPEIFRILEANVARRGYADVRLLHGAVTTQSGLVKFHHEGADAGRIRELSEAMCVYEVPSVALDELLGEPVDLLKIDIEGAETGVLCESRRLHMAAQLFVEHHGFAGDSQTLHSVLDCLQSAGFRYYLQTQFCAARPLVEDAVHCGMDLQINVFAKRAIRGAA